MSLIWPAWESDAPGQANSASKSAGDWADHGGTTRVLEPFSADYRTFSTSPHLVGLSWGTSLLIPVGFSGFRWLSKPTNSSTVYVGAGEWRESAYLLSESRIWYMATDLACTIAPRRRCSSRMRSRGSPESTTSYQFCYPCEYDEDSGLYSECFLFWSTRVPVFILFRSQNTIDID